MNPTLKVLVAGAAGVGKSTAIRCLADGRVNATEVLGCAGGRSTTAALDYAEVDVERTRRLRLFGLPGEARFAHMHPIVARGAAGVIVLVDNSGPDPVAECIADIGRLNLSGGDVPVVVGITRTEICMQPDVGEYDLALAAHGICAPILIADPRQRDDLFGLLDVLLIQIDDVDAACHRGRLQ